MVALVDALEGKGLVRRQPHAEDRRRNVVALTEAGAEVLRQGGEAAQGAERRFLAPLRAQDARQLRNALLTLVQAQHRGG